MEWNLFAIAALLLLSGFYFLTTELEAAPEREAIHHPLRAPRDVLEQAWHSETVLLFMRQVLAMRRRRQQAWL